MSKNVEKLCLIIIRWGSCLILFLPLFVYRGTLYPYIFGKIIGFRILVEIIFAAWLFLAVYNKNYRPHWKNPLIFSSAIFIVILFLTALTGVDFQRSFWSSQERMTGVLTFVHFWLWFIILTSVFRDWKDWKKLIWASLICSFLVGLYGLGQKFGLKFLLKETNVWQMTSTLGNPIYLGVYSMLHVFWAGFLLIQEKKRLAKIFAILFLLFNLVMMCFAASRGVLVAFGLSFLLFLGYAVFSLPTRRLKLIFIPVFILLILILVSGVFFLQTQKGKPWVYKAPYFIVKITDLTGSAWERTIAWNAGWQSFKERTIFGWGWENFNIIFNKHYLPYYLQSGQENTWFDRSHNQVIDLLALTGILGTLAYLVMCASIFLLLLRKKRDTNILMHTNDTNKQNSHGRIRIAVARGGGALLACMFSAYFIQNLTVFDTPAPLIIFYFGLGLVYFVTSSPPTNYELGRITNNPNPQAPKYPRPEGRRFPLPVLIFLIIIFLPWAIYKFNLEPFQQSRLGIKAIFYSQTDLKTGLNFYKKALAKPVFTNPEIRLQLAKTIYEQKGADPELFKAGLNFAISEIEKNVKEHPLDVRYWLYLGQLYNLGHGYDSSYLEKAEEAMKQGLKLSLKRQQVYFELARTKIFKKEYQEAVQLNQEAVQLDDQIGESHFNLGLTYLSAQKLKPGLAEIDKAQVLGYPVYQNPEINVFLAQNYAKGKQAGRALDFIDRAIQIQPENLNYVAQKIIICHQIKYTEMAQNLLEELKAKNPDYAAGLEEYLKTLK